MRRRLTRRQRKKQRKIIIITSLSLLCILTVGYAAFQTNLNITAKANILEKPFKINELKSKVTTSGDGLYKDTYENDRYIYRGTNPDNYITFNNELWRIVSIEQDNTLKIRKNESIGSHAYDKDNSRYQANTYCGHDNNKIHGCNVWGSKTTMMDSNGNKITELMPLSGTTKLTLPDKEASLNTYLNEEYYNNLSEEDKSKIITHRWNVGQVLLTTYQTLSTDITQEKQNTWDGKVALINASDYIKSSTNNECKGVYFSRTSSLPCKDSYLASSNWTITNGYNQHSVWNIVASSSLGHSFADSETDIYPAVYLNKDILLTGKGTQTNPYNIK